MIAANELRIGNWLHSRISGKDFQCAAEGIFDVAEGQDAGLVRAIPLSEGWLVKLGFKKTEPDMFMLNDHEERVTVKDSPRRIREPEAIHVPERHFIYERAYTKPGGETEWIFINLVAHVHQLQNLYFALTGEELVVRL